ncbi:MAG: ADP-ribosylglycohydrolase family protein [Labilithrix sp.]|nr:ADP-ribosylglycohydrolase family protein [Labilithrix sp.]MCW5811872.1 ADP-ribosylglycohydrolase family protein [Labilithrix sp.]
MTANPSTTLEAHALGAVLGALAGDAAGAVLEFFGRDITDADVRHALAMPGGGTWEVAPGQVTDDGELTMSLLHALAEAPARPTAAAAARYARWVDSDPFDIGATTAASLGCLRRHEHAAQAEEHGAARVMTVVAHARCSASKANGSLMRATPLAVWGAARDVHVVTEATMADARLSHPNPACVGAAVAYVLAIRHLLRAPDDVAGAVAEAERALAPAHFEEPRAWLAEAIAGMHVPYTPLDGFVRIAFTHAFRHLLAGTSWEDAIAETLRGGGDTDTNACIVGGLLGARWGIDAVPPPMLAAVEGSPTDAGVHPRPSELHPRDVRALVRCILGDTTR